MKTALSCSPAISIRHRWKVIDVKKLNSSEKLHCFNCEPTMIVHEKLIKHLGFFQKKHSYMLTNGTQVTGYLIRGKLFDVKNVY